MNDSKPFGGGSNDVAAHAVQVARNAGSSAPPAGSGHRADCVLPPGVFRPGGGPAFSPRMSPGAKTAFDNPARPAGRVGPGWPHAEQVMAEHIYRDTPTTLAFEQLVKPAEPNPAWRTIYNVDGSSVQTYAIDARTAVERFPDQWSYEPWPVKRRK